MLITDFNHFRVRQLLHDRLSAKPKVDLAQLFHKESSVVDDTASEQAFQHKLFTFKHGVNFNNSTLEEEQRGGIGARLLQNLVFLKSFCS